MSTLSTGAYSASEEIDERLFGSTELAESAFKLSVSLLEILLAEIVQSFPEQVCGGSFIQLTRIRTSKSCSNTWNRGIFEQ
jgi:hypothetical protein